MNGLLIDCFAGGGGASKGIELALNRPIDIAINHDPEAIRIHRVNHPHTLHLTEDIFTVDLPKYVAGRPVDLMWASPDCTSHSKAKGGQPRHQGLRILPWAVYKHAKAILPEVIIMENVEEIQPWQFGHPVTKKTRLWLIGLPLLVPTDIVEPQGPYVPAGTGRKDKSKYGAAKRGQDAINRAKTFPGVAAAMAEQWAGPVTT